MTSRSPATRLPLSSAALAAAAVALATLAVYWPARQAGFVGDDFMILHRLRGLDGASDALRFFQAEFFDYYRPLGFLSHAVDWSLAGDDPRQYHLTNLLLHALSSVLVFFIARAFSPDWIAGPAAALLFALHTSNHEAVVWISARFDLLATFWALAAVAWMVNRLPGEAWGPPLLFLPALLSKESVVALPVAAAAWFVFCQRYSTRETVLRLTPWLGGLAAYAILRQAAGGVSAFGGAGRAPKLLVFAGVLLALTACADGRWLRLRTWLISHAQTAGALLIAGAAGLAIGALLPGPFGALAREKLAVVGFATVYLAAPVADAGSLAGTLLPLEPLYWRVALTALAAAAVLGFVAGPRLLNDDRAWFFLAFLVAVLLPISALTEGRRYLYLPSAVVSIAIGVWIGGLRRRWRAAALAAVAVLLAVSSWQIAAKLRDWIWAGDMTAAGARLADSSLAPACDSGHVVFLTSPVGVRGVYTHFYYETFEPPRGCIPETFNVLARVLRVDAALDVNWDGPSRIVMTAAGYRGNFLLSRDLRHFDMPLHPADSLQVDTPIGELTAGPAGTDMRLTLRLADTVDRSTKFFYYSRGEIRPLLRPQAP